MRFQWLALASLVGSCLSASPGAAFSIYGPTQDIAQAARWTPTGGLGDGIRVGVDASFVAAWSMTTTDAAIVEGWVEAAFAVWENPALQFDIRFGDLDDAEIILQALPGADPLGGFYGYATPDWGFDSVRMLTNGQTVPGYTIEHARIDIAAERLQTVGGFSGLGVRFQGRIVTRLFMHEIGHAIGLGHTNDPFNVYYDTDFDPDNAMEIDPSDPFAGLLDSPNRFTGSVMSNQPCGEDQVICNALFATSLSFDDIGGRDVLYPVPEPSLVWLAAFALLIASRRRRSGDRSTRPGHGGRTRRA